MQIRPIQAVTCVLLHERYDPVDGLQLLDFVSLAASRAGLSARAVTGPASTEKDVDVRFGDVRVTVRQAAQPVSPKSLAAALDYPVTHLMMPEAKAIAGRHAASTLVSVERLSEREPDLAADEPQRGPAFEQWRQARSAMMACLLVADYVAGKNRASAVHWRPSDHLVPQSVLREAARGEAPQAPYALFVRAHLTLGEDQDGSAAVKGIEAAGADHLIGVPVSVAPEDVPYGWMADRAVDFIVACHQRGAIPPDGDRVGDGESELVRVDHLPPTEHRPAGEVRLVAVRSERHGIGDGAPGATGEVVRSALSGRSGAELDPDDEIDQAILMLLAERERRDGVAPQAAMEEQPGTASETAPAAPVPFKSAALGDDAERGGSARPALALAELRRIANGGAMPPPRERNRPVATLAAEPPRFARAGVETEAVSAGHAPADAEPEETFEAEKVDVPGRAPVAPDTGACVPDAEPVAFDRLLVSAQPADTVPDAEPVAFDLLVDPGHQAGLLRGILAKLARRTIRRAA